VPNTPYFRGFRYIYIVEVSFLGEPEMKNNFPLITFQLQKIYLFLHIVQFL